MKKNNCCCNGSLKNATHSKTACTVIVEPVSKLSTTFIHNETKIRCSVNAETGTLTLQNGQLNRFHSQERNSFVFIDSKPETVRKVAEAILAILKAIK